MSLKSFFINKFGDIEGTLKFEEKFIKSVEKFKQHHKILKNQKHQIKLIIKSK
jgi:hypothetical protein